MPPIIRYEECSACGRCAESFPIDVLHMDEEGPVVRYPEECWHCGCCRLECPNGYLGIRFSLRMLVTAAGEGVYL